MSKKLIVVLSMLLLCTSAWAETRYISDVVLVPVRSGAGNQFRIIHSGIRSGTKMTVLEDPGGDWTKIRTEGGMEGWVRTQYLTSQPTAQLQLNDAQTRLKNATQKAQSLEEQLQTLEAEHDSLNKEASQQAQERDTYAEELQKLKVLSADAVNLNQRYQELLQRHEMIQTEFDAVRAENDRLKSDQTINQWLFGAGLMILGMILMLVLPALKPKKRHSEWAG